MKVLITGGAGFIGSHLAERHLGCRDEVHIIDDLSTGSIANIQHLKEDPRFHYHIDTVTNTLVMAELVDLCDLIYHLAAAVGVPNKVAKSFTIAYAELAVRETKKSGVSVLPGIGRLVRVDRKARMGRNPATGEAIKIPAKKVVKFRVAKAVRDSIVPPKKK